MRSRMLSSIGIVTLAVSAAACGDAATAPQATNAPKGLDQGSKFLTPIASVTVKIVDIWGTQLTEGGARVKFTTSAGTVQAQDNVYDDLDPVLGSVKVLLSPAVTYEACVYSSTANYHADPGNPTYPICRTVSPGTLKVEMGSVFMRRKPKVAFHFQDMTGNPVLGATLAMVWPGNWYAMFYDGQPGWDAVEDGKIVLKLTSGPGTYSWCEAKAPTGYMMANPQCGSFQAHYDVDTAILLQHKPLMKLPPL